MVNGASTMRQTFRRTPVDFFRGFPRPQPALRGYRPDLPPAELSPDDRLPWLREGPIDGMEAPPGFPDRLGPGETEAGADTRGATGPVAA